METRSTFNSGSTCSHLSTWDELLCSPSSFNDPLPSLSKFGCLSETPRRHCNRHCTRQSLTSRPQTPLGQLDILRVDRCISRAFLKWASQWTQILKGASGAHTSDWPYLWRLFFGLFFARQIEGFPCAKRQGVRRSEWMVHCEFYVQMFFIS